MQLKKEPYDTVKEPYDTYENPVKEPYDTLDTVQLTHASCAHQRTQSPRGHYLAALPC